MKYLNKLLRRSVQDQPEKRKIDDIFSNISAKLEGLSVDFLFFLSNWGLASGEHKKILEMGKARVRKYHSSEQIPVAQFESIAYLMVTCTLSLGI